jgi:hypothetical protein
MTGFVLGAQMPAHVWLDGPNLSLGGRNEREQQALCDAILTGRTSSVYIPIIEAIDQRLMSRFLAKVALEVLAHRIIHIEAWNDEIVDKEALDPLRHFARVGDRPEKWPFSRRRIYGEDDLQRRMAAATRFCMNLRSSASHCPGQATSISTPSYVSLVRSSPST